MCFTTLCSTVHALEALVGAGLALQSFEPPDEIHECDHVCIYIEGLRLRSVE